MSAPTRPIGRPLPVAVLGATGTVGERLLALLDGHPWFRVAEVAGSDRSAGVPLGERLASAADGLSEAVRTLELRSPDTAFESPLILSALPATQAREIEPRLAASGRLVVSNASAFRDDPRVPLVIADVNPSHLALLDAQPGPWSGSGAHSSSTTGGIVTNPNCSVAALAVALKPLHDAFGLRSVVVTTMQAISGAGRPGPSALDLVDNLIPFIGNEEDKVEREPRKILGTLADGAIGDADFTVSATCTRVPVLHGHTASVSVAFDRPAGPDDVREVLASWRSPIAHLGLPTAPERPLVVLEADDRPQPRVDRDTGNGMTVSVGRIRPCPVQHVGFVVLGHNLVRGAAGAALINAELCVAEGRVPQ